MPHIHTVSCAFPPHYFDQDQLIDRFRDRWKQKYFNFHRIEELHRKVLVAGRHLALPVESYENLTGFGARNDAWIAVALEVAARAVVQVLEKAGLQPRDIQLLTSTSVTGLAVPSLEARLMNQLDFSIETKRMPLFGLGCLAGIAGLNRVNDYLIGHPDEAALFISVELCSLTTQWDDLSIANLISTGLFGDGGAAVLMVGDRHPLAKSAPLEILKTRSVFFPQTEKIMGWDIVDTGFKVVLSGEVPELVTREFPTALSGLLERSGVTQAELEFFVAHPGGPRVLQAMESVLGLSQGELALSWQSLQSHGNMSSVSALHVLEQTLKKDLPSGSYGLMTAFGPAFCCELGLLRGRQKVEEI